MCNLSIRAGSKDEINTASHDEKPPVYSSCFCVSCFASSLKTIRHSGSVQGLTIAAETLLEAKQQEIGVRSIAVAMTDGSHAHHVIPRLADGMFSLTPAQSLETSIV